LRINLETFGELEDVLKRDVALSPFNRADIGAVQAGTVGKLFLGDAGRSPEALQVERKYLLWR